MNVLYVALYIEAEAFELQLRMCTLALGYTTIFVQKQIVETNYDVMSATQAESHCSLMLQSLAFGKRMHLR